MGKNFLAKMVAFLLLVLAAILFTGCAPKEAQEGVFLVHNGDNSSSSKMDLLSEETKMDPLFVSGVKPRLEYCLFQGERKLLIPEHITLGIRRFGVEPPSLGNVKYVDWTRTKYCLFVEARVYVPANENWSDERIYSWVAEVYPAYEWELNKLPPSQSEPSTLEGTWRLGN